MSQFYVENEFSTGSKQAQGRVIRGANLIGFWNVPVSVREAVPRGVCLGSPSQTCSWQGPVGMCRGYLAQAQRGQLLCDHVGQPLPPTDLSQSSQPGWWLPEHQLPTCLMETG